MINIDDVLVLPDGTPMKDAEITITTVKSDKVLTGSFLKVTTTDTGGFKTPLHTGIYTITSKPKRNHIVMEVSVEVTDLTPTPITLVQLINDYPYVEPEEPKE